MRKAKLILLIVIGMLFSCEYVLGEQASRSPGPVGLQTKEPNLPQDENYVAAVFDGKELTLGQMMFFGPRLDYAMAREIADFWLNTQLLYEQAVKQGIDKDEKTKFLADISYKKTIASKLLEKVQSEVKITDQQVRKYYDETKQTDPTLTEPMYLSFSHITLNSLEDANAAIKRINAGEDINKLAGELSVASDAQKEGRVEKYQENAVKSRFGEEFLAALLNATEGQIIGPVKNREDKYEVARHEGKRAARIKDFEKVQQMIRTNIESQAQKKAVDDLINGLKENAKQRYKMNLVTAEKDNKQGK